MSIDERLAAIEQRLAVLENTKVVTGAKLNGLELTIVQHRLGGDPPRKPDRHIWYGSMFDVGPDESHLGVAMEVINRNTPKPGCVHEELTIKRISDTQVQVNFTDVKRDSPETGDRANPEAGQ